MGNRFLPAPEKRHRDDFHRISVSPRFPLTVQEMPMVAAMEQFGLILASQPKILECVFQDGLAEETKPRQRLAIYEQSVKRLEELANLAQISGASDAEIFQGLKLIPGKSQFSMFEGEVTIEPEKMLQG